MAFFGCLSSSPCGSLSITDSENNLYTQITTATAACGGSCEETAFWTKTSTNANDTLYFESVVPAYLGGDVYVLSGVGTIPILSATGTSNSNSSPSTSTLVPTANSFVAAGVIANSAAVFTAGSGYTLIFAQPETFQQDGGWQASEYQTWESAGPGTNSTFGYPTVNAGWAEVSVSIPSSVAIHCVPSKVTVGASSDCTATVSGLSPTGTITWSSVGQGEFSASSCTLAAGTCQVAFTPTSAGSIVVRGNYSGDPNNQPATGTFILAVFKANTTTSVVCSPSTVSVGSPTTCTATVFGSSPTGIILWSSSGTANFSPVPSCTLSSSFSCSVTYSPAASSSPITITASYGGDSNNWQSSSNFSLAVGSLSSASTHSPISLSSTAAVFSSSSYAASSVSSIAGHTPAGGSSSSLLAVIAVIVIVVVALGSALLLRRGSRSSR